MAAGKAASLRAKRIARIRKLMIELVQLGSEHPASYFERIAELHIDTIHHGVLPMLGKRFLSRMYRELTGCPFCSVLGAVENDKVVGYLAGCADTEEFYRSINESRYSSPGISFPRTLQTRRPAKGMGCRRLPAQRRKYCSRGRRGP